MEPALKQPSLSLVARLSFDGRITGVGLIHHAVHQWADATVVPHVQFTSDKMHGLGAELLYPEGLLVLSPSEKQLYFSKDSLYGGAVLLTPHTVTPQFKRSILSAAGFVTRYAKEYISIYESLHR